MARQKQYLTLYTIAIIAIIVAIVYFTCKTLSFQQEGFDNQRDSKIAVAVLCLKPAKLWLDFLATFTAHDVYLIIDDESQMYADNYAKEYPTIHFVQIDSKKCKTAFFTNMNPIFGKPVTAWEKAIYYFQYENTSYDSVWYLEDDIFIYSESTLISINSKYPTSDLLTAEHQSTGKDYKKDPWWGPRNIQIGFEPPYSKAMVCGIRVSKAFLSIINDYAQQNHTLFFLEALFPSLAKKYQVVYDTPDQMNTIVYRRSWTIEDISRNKIFHPVKDLHQQLEFREALNTRIEG